MAATGSPLLKRIKKNSAKGGVFRLLERIEQLYSVVSKSHVLGRTDVLVMLDVQAQFPFAGV